MKELSLKDSKKLYAGGLSAAAYAAIAAGISFLVGILDGISRPFKCR